MAAEFYRVVVNGPGPGPRYGHVMALVGQRYLMAIGGNDGTTQIPACLLCVPGMFALPLFLNLIGVIIVWYLLFRKETFG